MSDRKPIAPTISKGASSIHDSVETHPAYGQIGANRVTSMGPGGNLYGSDFEHHNFVVISIRRSELHRGLSNDWPHARDELIEVALSEAQWASFVSTLNSGMGTQCTIQHINCEAVPQIALKTDRREQIKAEAQANLKEIMEDAKKLAEEIEGRGRKVVMRDLLSGIVAQFRSSSGLAFIARQFDEHIEKTVEHAKIEVNAYIEGRIHSAGMASLKGEPPPISLPGAKKP